MASLGACVALLVLAGTAVCLSASDTLGRKPARCPLPVQRHSLSGESLLMQVQSGVSKARKANESAVVQRSFGITSDCAKRLNAWSRSNAACLLIRGETTLLVKVPYGRSPGWDFPGGRRHSGEFACETAERETCEETGYQVRAVEQLSSTVFRCKVVASNVCRKPVDEGFLEKNWWPENKIDHLHYRGGTWGGNKRGLIKQEMQQASSSPGAPDLGADGSEELDVCGCRMCAGEGFSTRAQACARGSNSERGEACTCLRRHQGQDGKDTCGCRPCQGEGWSTTRGRCARGSDTDAREACECARRGVAALAQAA
jgi:8-oxo-dGTP pyrophosphatase MutT (NUDIX family)